MRTPLPLTLLAAFIAGCAVGPAYKQPAALKSEPLPDAFTDGARSLTNAPQFKPASPSAHLPRGAWWNVFGDPTLDRLEDSALVDNQDLAAAAARLDETYALLKEARAQFYPQFSIDPSVARQRTSVNAPQLGKPAGAAYTFNSFYLPGQLTWEIDLWGRVRRQTQAAHARFAASAEEFESAKLALQAAVAADYFTLRALDAQRALVSATIDTYSRSLELTQHRRRGGVASDLDVSEAETQLRSTQAQMPALDLDRATLVHALAVLCGIAPVDFQIEIAPMTHQIPTVPVLLPAGLLERRPDIAAAERLMAAANADVGVAVSAFFPQITFNALGGFQSVNAGSLFDWPSRLWALGPSVTVPVFTGGRLRGQVRFAKSAYNETVAHYRQTVLQAFQEVQDLLAAQRLLVAEMDSQAAALAAARHTLDVANNRYRAGLVTYLEVATAQSAALANETILVQLEGRRLVTQVELIKALGGSWDSQ